MDVPEANTLHDGETETKGRNSNLLQGQSNLGIVLVGIPTPFPTGGTIRSPVVAGAVRLYRSLELLNAPPTTAGFPQGFGLALSLRLTPPLGARQTGRSS